MFIIVSEKQKQNFKQRHIALTIYILIFLFIDFYIVKSNVDPDITNDVILNDESTSLHWFFVVLTAVDFIAILFLLQWHKWAFWILLATSLVSVGINVFISENFISLFGLVFITGLFGLLQVKKSGISGWKKLH